ncbi:MAG: hypothetical protein WAU58_12470 [Terriglobales bacterium]
MRTERSIVFYVRDPGTGFRILLAQGVVNELIYCETCDEVLMIKHTS